MTPDTSGPGGRGAWAHGQVSWLTVLRLVRLSAVLPSPVWGSGRRVRSGSRPLTVAGTAPAWNGERVDPNWVGTMRPARSHRIPFSSRSRLDRSSWTPARVCERTNIGASQGRHRVADKSTVVNIGAATRGAPVRGDFHERAWFRHKGNAVTLGRAAQILYTCRRTHASRGACRRLAECPPRASYCSRSAGSDEVPPHRPNRRHHDCLPVSPDVAAPPACNVAVRAPRPVRP